MICAPPLALASVSANCWVRLDGTASGIAPLSTPPVFVALRDGSAVVDESDAANDPGAGSAGEPTIRGHAIGLASIGLTPTREGGGES
jgi:hypothetical protein